MTMTEALDLDSPASLELIDLEAREQGEMPHGATLVSGRRALEDLSMLIALAVALLLTVTVLVVPPHRWGPNILYGAAPAVLLWVAIDLRRKLRDTPAGSGAMTNPADKAPAKQASGHASSPLDARAP